MSEILVVGGAGYIGSHMCKHLHARGLKPVVLDNLSLGHKESVNWGPEFNSLEKIIHTSWNWQTNNPKGYAITKAS